MADVTIRRYWQGGQRWAEVLLNGCPVGFARARRRQTNEQQAKQAYLSLARDESFFAPRAVTGRTLRDCVNRLRAEISFQSAVLSALSPAKRHGGGLYDDEEIMGAFV